MKLTLKTNKTMAVHITLKSLFNDIAKALQETIGSNALIKADDFPEKIRNLASPMVLDVFATTVRKNASQTANYASNDRIRIRGNDGNDYTLAQWNALFVEANYNKDAMTVQPIGMRFQCSDTDEVYLFDRYTGVTYNPSGETAGTAGKLQHSLYNHNLVVAAGSGTDSTTGKGWTVTADGDNLVLYEENTKCSWTIAKNTGGVYRHRAWNIEDRVHSLWAQTEWMRHRMAIDSNIATDEEDGTMAVVDILNENGQQPAVGEDMYFWLGRTNTGILAKYNINNRHAVSGYSLTQAIADAIYDKQVAMGVNMNDTGVNSETKHVLAPGSKGAEAIAVGGKWMIITPYISRPNATTTAIENNVADSPAVYWAVSKGCALPSDTMLDGMYLNLSLCNAVINYLNQVEGRGFPVIPISDYIWSAVRSSATNCWYVNMSTGIVSYVNSYFRFFVCGASASN